MSRLQRDLHIVQIHVHTYTQIHLYVQIRSTNTYIYIYLHRTLYIVHYTPTKYILHDISYNCTGLYQIVVYRLVLYCIVLYLYHIVLYWRVSNHSVLYCSEYCVGRSYNIQCIVLYCFVYGFNHTLCRSCRLVAASHSLRLQTLYRLHHREKQDTRLHCTAGPSKVLVRPVKCTTLDVHIVYAYNMMRNTPKHLMSFCTASYKPSALSNRQSSLSVPAFYLSTDI